MRIFLGADHNGFDLKAQIADHLQRSGFEVVDEGDKQLSPNDDYPQFASRVVSAMLASGEAEPLGILICGSGQGMCIAANRFKGIRAALCWNIEEARAARNDDNSNVLCLPARYIKPEEAISVVQAWLNTPFAAAPRFSRRLQELDELG